MTENRDVSAVIYGDDAPGQPPERATLAFSRDTYINEVFVIEEAPFDVGQRFGARHHDKESAPQAPSNRAHIWPAQSAEPSFLHIGEKAQQAGLPASVEARNLDGPVSGQNDEAGNAVRE